VNVVQSGDSSRGGVKGLLFVDDSDGGVDECSRSMAVTMTFMSVNSEDECHGVT